MWTVLLLLGAMAWLANGAGVPLYDGIGFPDEPYRFVQAPPGAPHGPPAAGVTNTTALGDLGLQTAEQGPQLSVYIPVGVLRTPAGATQITATGTPLTPDGTTPFGPIDGNIYRLTVTSNAGPVTLTVQSANAAITLRATGSRPSVPAGVYRPTPTAPWARVQTGQAGADLYTIEFRGNGDYALTLPTVGPVQSLTGQGNSGQGSTGPNPSTGHATAAASDAAHPATANTRGGTKLGLVAAIVGGFLLLLALVAVLSRRRAARPATGNTGHPRRPARPQDGRRPNPRNGRTPRS